MLLTSEQYNFIKKKRQTDRQTEAFPYKWPFLRRYRERTISDNINISTFSVRKSAARTVLFSTILVHSAGLLPRTAESHAATILTLRSYSIFLRIEHVVNKILCFRFIYDMIWYICYLQLGWHPVAAVQYTFTHKQYIEQYKTINT
jgi:hypothetical protein